MLERSPSERSLIQIKNNNGPRMEPWGTPRMTFVHMETWPLRTTHYLLLIKTSRQRLNKFPQSPCLYSDIPFINIRMLILSWLCTLLESKFLIILAISSWEKVTDDKRFWVKYCICVRECFYCLIGNTVLKKMNWKVQLFLRN